MRLGFHPAPWTRDGRPESFYRALDEISLSGWDGLELSGSWVVEAYGSRPAELRALLALHDLELSASYCGLSYLPEQRAREDMLIRRVIDVTAEVGGRILLIDGAPPQPEGTSEADIGRVADFANRIGAWARQAGLRCAWHQHWGTMFETRAPFARLMALTDPDLLGFCPDTAQLSMGDFELPATFHEYGPRIAYVHFKDLAPNHDWRLAAGHGGPATWSDTGAYHVDSRWRFVELGRGQIDFAALLEILHGVGFQGWIVDDFDYSAYAAREASTTCLRYLRQALGLVGRRGQVGWAG